MASKTNRQQAMRVRIARSMGSHACGYTALHGYARFLDKEMALMFAEHSTMDGAQVHVFSQSNQTAVDWTCGTRYGNGQVADRVG